MKYQDLNSIQSIFKPRNAFSEKRDFGHSLLIAGSSGKMGAALIAARSCLRAGTGLLTVNVPFEERLVLQIGVPEAMLAFREDFKIQASSFSAIGIGPGIGVNAGSKELMESVITEFKLPLVLDADALNLISADKGLLAALVKNSILTPHAREFDRLFGEHQDFDERVLTAKTKAKELGLIIVLKGHQTCIVAPDEYAFNTTGNAGLAKGGSGDALLGMITAFLAQGYTPFNAAKLGVYMHGLAADLCQEKESVESMMVTDVIENIGRAFKEIND